MISKTTALTPQEKRLHLIQLLQQKKGSLSIAPLSLMQERLWLADLLATGTPLYNLSMSRRFTATLTIAALERGINDLIQRYDVLRTAFILVNDEPVQAIAPATAMQKLAFPLIDLRALPDAMREQATLQLVQEEAQLPFDTTSRPLMRVKLLRLGAQEHVLTLTMHHLICDAQSCASFIRELDRLYNAYVAGKPSPLVPLQYQYADFARWQRAWLAGEQQERQVAYWRNQLKDVPVLELPTDFARPLHQAFRGARYSFALDVVNSVRAFSRGAKVTLFITVLAIFQLLLSQYSGQQDIAVGTTTANRNNKKFDNLIGVFTNILVLRTNLAGSATFRELLMRVRTVALMAYENQDIPFHYLVHKLRPSRDPGRQVLFQVLFQLRIWQTHTDTQDASGPGGPFEWQGSQTAKFDLSLDILDTTQGLQAYFEYNTALFQHESIVRMAEHFQRLIKNCVAYPDKQIGELCAFLHDNARLSSDQ
jgi:hypothetical protein